MLFNSKNPVFELADCWLHDRFYDQLPNHKRRRNKQKRDSGGLQTVYSPMHDCTSVSTQQLCVGEKFEKQIEAGIILNRVRYPACTPQNRGVGMASDDAQWPLDVR